MTNFPKYVMIVLHMNLSRVRTVRFTQIVDDRLVLQAQKEGDGRNPSDIIRDATLDYLNRASRRFLFWRWQKREIRPTNGKYNQSK